MAYQRAYFPVKTISLSQGYSSNSSSHKLSYALDLAGAQDVFAPFDCVITKLYQPDNTRLHANTVWLTSTKKVMSPNGYYGYLTISITHPSEIGTMKKGTKFRQGERICTTSKMTGNATGNHLHLEVAKGTIANWSKKVSGNYSEYVMTNNVKPEEYLFVREDAVIKKDIYKGKKYNFVKESDITYVVTEVPSEPLNVRSSTSLNSSKNIIGGLTNGDEVIRFYSKGNMSYIYHYEIMGYVSNRYLKKKV